MLAASGCSPLRDPLRRAFPALAWCSRMPHQATRVERTRSSPLGRDHLSITNLSAFSFKLHIHLSQRINSITITMAAAYPPGQTFFDNVKKSFVDVPVVDSKDSAIPTTEFLEAAESLTTLFDVLGSAAFKPVKNDMNGNIKVGRNMGVEGVKLTHGRKSATGSLQHQHSLRPCKILLSTSSRRRSTQLPRASYG
jgi:hypothetical protein